ncbi:hypothetical protein QUC31_007034 [Theobroma cacao]
MRNSQRKLLIESDSHNAVTWINNPSPWRFKQYMVQIGWLQKSISKWMVTHKEIQL